MSRVTFLMPIKAPAPYLDHALNSILEQTYEDWDLVVALDGWDDTVATTIRDIIPEAKLTVAQVPFGTGITFALNQGLSRCEGKWVARIDADDVSFPERLSEQLSAAQENPEVAVWGSWTRVLDEAGSDIGGLEFPSGADVRESLLWRNVVPHSSAFFVRDVVRTLGGYNSICRHCEDYDLWMRVGSLAPVGVVPRELIGYRISEGQVSRNPSPRIARNALRVSRGALAVGIGVPRWSRAMADFAFEVKSQPAVSRRFGGLRKWR